MTTPSGAGAIDGWRALLGPRYLRTSTLLAGGVALYATNEFVTASLLPSTIADIGGDRLYAWVTTLYLVGSVVTASTVNAALSRIGPRLSYLLGLAAFGVGSVVCAVAPGMDVLLVGRTLQGAAGGLLAGLGYALVNAVLPASLWTRASALVAAMWGVATVIGPAAGGFFAQFGWWRWAFGVVAILTAAMAVLVPGVLPGRGDAHSARGVPVPSVLLLGAAALAISLAQVPTNPAVTAVLLVVSLGLLGAFVLVDRRSSVKVLPPSTFGAGPVKWIYLSLAVLMASAMVDMYVPLFGQRLAHLGPAAAGFLGAALAVGWTLGEVLSASLNSSPAIRRVVVASPLALAAGLALAAATQVDNAPMGVVVTWAVAFAVTGLGLGGGWPHLSAWAMRCVDDAEEGASAAAAINTVELISGAFGAGLAGVVVNSVHSGMATAATALFAVFSVVAVMAAFTAYRARVSEPI